MRCNHFPFHPGIKGVIVTQHIVRRSDALLDHLLEGLMSEQVGAQPDALTQSRKVEWIGQQVEVEFRRMLRVA